MCSLSGPGAGGGHPALHHEHTGTLGAPLIDTDAV
jgi:hypothetical protein